ncbi:MAG: twin-arginine translocase TatA/TatE family subunit [candidate division Zixibacteria bacterium]
MSEILLISMPGGGELIIILVIVLILFGAKRIPEIAQGLGKGIREFKRSVKEVQSEIDTNDTPDRRLEEKKEKEKPEKKDE